MRVLLVVVLSLLVPVAPAWSAPPCKVVADAFSLFDRAGAVVIAEVTKAAEPGEGYAGVDLRRVRVLKGTVGKTFQGLSSTTCGPVLAAREQVVVFLDDAGVQLGVARSPKAIATALAQWSGARTMASRTKLLATLAKHADAEVRTAAQQRQAVDAKMTRASGAAWNQPAPGWKPPGTAAAAGARLKALWSTVVAAASPGMLRFEKTLPSCKLNSFKRLCAESAAILRDVHGANADPADLGSIRSLDAGGVCWEVWCSETFFSNVAFISAYDGALLLIWQPPEG